MQPPNSHHLEAAHGWLELGNHEAAFDELEKIEPKLRGHPDVLEVRVDIYANAGKWDYCVENGDALVRVTPERPSGWLKRSHALHQLGKTQEAYDALHDGLYQLRDEHEAWYDLARYSCALDDVERARKMIEKAIELGGGAVKLRALDDEGLIRVWAGP